MAINVVALWGAACVQLSLWFVELWTTAISCHRFVHEVPCGAVSVPTRLKDSVDKEDNS